MGTIDDVRKVIQDLVAPDLKAIDARINALDHKIDMKVDALDKKIDIKFDLLDHKIDLKYDALDNKIDVKFELLASEIRAFTATVASNHAFIMHALDIDRRL